MKKYSILLGLLVSQWSWSMPAQVILIRHGEKPSLGNGLSPQGFARANALSGFFETNPIVTQFGPIVAIYAMAPGSTDGSLRPIQTMTPTATAMKITMQDTLTKDQADELVNEIQGNVTYNGKTVVICWEHKMIPVIANTFGLKNGPQNWDGSIFDRAWVLRFPPSSGIVTFQDVGEKVLPGDSTN